MGERSGPSTVEQTPCICTPTICCHWKVERKTAMEERGWMRSDWLWVLLGEEIQANLSDSSTE